MKKTPDIDDISAIAEDYADSMVKEAIKDLCFHITLNYSKKRKILVWVSDGDNEKAESFSSMVSNLIEGKDSCWHDCPREWNEYVGFYIEDLKNQIKRLERTLNP